MSDISIREKALDFLSDYSDCNLTFSNGSLDRASIVDALAAFAESLAQPAPDRREMAKRLTQIALDWHWKGNERPLGDLIEEELSR